MTLPELAAALEPVADASCRSDDADVVKISTVLAAIMGAIAGGDDPDREVIDALAINAGLICEHRSGLHAKKAPG